MVGNLQPSELRKLKKQKEGEEDPVIVAQRFLNIYRQLHIFTPEKKAAFNQMLLELKPEIKAVFTSLPGGIVIQDYIEELEEKEGIISTTPVSSAISDTTDEEVSKAKILATALAEAQIQVSAQTQQQTPPPSSSAPFQTATPSKLELGKDFAQELAGALSSALKFPTQPQQDISAIIDTLGQNQKEIINILQSEQAHQQTEMQNLTKMLLASQHQLSIALQQNSVSPAAAPTVSQSAAPGIDNSAALAKLSENQKQIAQMISTLSAGTKNNNQEFLNIFEASQKQFHKTLQALSEERRQDNKEITQAVISSQKELAQFFLQNNNTVTQTAAPNAMNQTANNIQINSSDYSAQLSLIAEKLGNLQTISPAASLEKAVEQIITAQSRLYQETLAAQTKELGAVIKLALQESQKISNENLISALEKMPKSEIVYSSTPVNQPYNGEVFIPTPVAETTQEFQTDIENVQDIPVEYEAKENTFDEYVQPVNDDTEKTTEEEISFEEQKKKKKRKKKKKNKPSQDFSDTLATDFQEANIITPPETFQEDFDIPDNYDNISPSSPDTEYPLPEAENNIFEENTDISDNNSVFNDTAEKTEDENSPFAEENMQSFSEPDIFSGEDVVSDTQSDNLANDWGFDTQNTISDDDIPLQTSKGWDVGFSENIPVPSDTEQAQNNDEQNWEWDYVESDGEDQDWEWAYEEDVSESNDNSLSVKIGNNSPIHSSDLYFQKAVISPHNTPFAEDFIDVQNHNIVIKDSRSGDEGNDPYQNSNLKH